MGLMLLLGLGMVLVIEGLVFALAPSRLDELLRLMNQIPVETRRLIGLAAMTLGAARPIDEAISTAGGVTFEALDARCMLRTAPGVFCAGEMLDWEAPTGGYLLQACLATGRAAGQGVLDWAAAGR